MITDDKFKRFLAMTDRPEDFSDEELMELARDPEMAAWYAALSDVEKAAKCKTEEASHPVSRPRALIIADECLKIIKEILYESKGQELSETNEKEDQPVTVQQATKEQFVTVTTKEKTVSHQGDTKPLNEKIAGHTLVLRSADLGEGVTMRPGKPCPTLEEAEPLPEEDISPIPTDKQALADMYLAEVALQVAYERQAQTEALRTYAASLEDEEEETSAQPIIAF